MKHAKEFSFLKKPEDVAQEWLDLKTQKILIEKRIADLKPILEAFLIEQPDFEAEMCGHSFKVTTTARESFKLAEAKKKIDKKLLKPFISVTEFNQIRSTFCGDAKTQNK